eukprot:14192853-Ditylum_brightwellii.AAC.1
MEEIHINQILYNGMETARTTKSVGGTSHTENIVLPTRQKHIQGGHTTVRSMAHQNIQAQTSYDGKNICIQLTA